MRWVTRENVQIDRMASAWLIRRFIDPQAEFTFVPRGTDPASIRDATPFHLEGADLCKTDQSSTFELIARAYHVSDGDPYLAQLGKLVRDADRLHTPVRRGHDPSQLLTPDLSAEAAGLQMVLHGTRVVADDDETALRQASFVLDAAYAALKARVEQRLPTEVLRQAEA